MDGDGVATLPTWALAEQLRSGVLGRVLSAWQAPVRTIFASHRRMSMKVRTVADHLANVLWPHAHREKLALPRSRMEGDGIPNLHEEWSIIV